MTAGYANVSKPSLAQDFCAHAGIFGVKMPRAMKVASAKAVKAEEAAKPVRKRKKTKPSDPDQEQESDEDKQVSGLPQSVQSILKASRGNSAAEKKAASAAEKKVAPEVPPDSAPKKPPEARAKRKRIPPKAQILIKKEPMDSSESAQKFGPAPEIPPDSAAVGKSRGALRNAFCRTIPGKLEDVRVQQLGVKGKSLHVMPQEVIDAMKTKADEEYWLQVFCANGMTWGRAKTWITKRKQDILEETDDWGWRTFEQIEKDYNSTQMATKMKDLCLTDADRWKWHDDFPGDDDAIQFWVQKSKSAAKKKLKTSESGVGIEADLDGSGTRTMMARCAIGTQRMQNMGKSLAGPWPAIRDCPSRLAAKGEQASHEHRAALCDRDSREAEASAKEDQERQAAEQKRIEEEKQKQLEEQKKKEHEKRQADLAAQRKKNEQKKLAEAKKKAAAKDPLNQATKWISGLAALLSDLAAQCKKAKGASKLPGQGGKTYETLLNGHKDKLTDIRSKLESNMTNKSALKTEMHLATQALQNSQKDLGAFKLLYSGYNPFPALRNLKS